MSFVARNRLLSALGVAQRLVVPVKHAHVARPAYSSVCHRNAAYRRTLENKILMAKYATTTSLTNKDEIRELMALWPDVVRDITESKISEIPEISKWIAKVLQYNVPGGKKTRGMALIYAYKLLAPSDQLTEENIRLARILAWCLELVASFILVYDDIQDRSLIRRNQPCWYLHNDIGLAAINDGLLMECVANSLIKKHFKGKEYYMDIVETFQEIILMTAMGQALDMFSTNFGKKPNLDLYTMDRYNNIVKYKCSYYTYILPVTLAMHLAGVRDPEKLRQTKTILLEMGHFYQVQDDYLGCYAKSEVVGKTSTDIQEGKCTWLIVMALQRATSEQRKILEECYGSSDPEKVQRVVQIYNDLGLPNTYSMYEEETYNLLVTHIQQMSRGLPHDLFLILLNRMYRRQH
ncbi:farnesyl pyrophosphate synthase-like isoform X2 [Nylanderia fulva]|uniref:farnesyl pyrophosphate synthase-like isoform X2 n=1 Tax=Nylanderia fulva TaxID=613905 RepID=UPI0010FB1F5F|nr:farnesyl pyrophosphate synthase-like isoform X2 [Nylanderia fulva]